MKMFVKVHQTYREVIAICDSDLIGKKFEQDNRQIEVKESFFQGEEMTEDQVTRVIEQGKNKDATFNIVGKNSVSLALKNNIISEEGIIRIQEVPVALVLL